MKSQSAALAAHYAQGSTTIAQCWKVTRKDGLVYAFTSVDQDLVVDGVTYLAASGFTPSSIAGSADLSVDNLEVVGFLQSPAITEADLRAGLWDDADVLLFEVNWRDLTQGKMILRTGKIGNVSAGRVNFHAELRGLTQQLSQNIGEVFAPACQADLGDARCKVNLTAYTVTGAATAVTDGRTFADSSRTEADDWFAGGKLTFTSGANAGLSMEVKSYAAGVFTLQLPMPYAITAGDAYSVYAGCRKRLGNDCQAKFNNVINFRGFPHVPGADKILGSANYP